jgi:predicted O-methyltransferase YrrM
MLGRRTIFPAGVRGAGDGKDGMLTEAEAELLAQLARGREVLEIGSWCGLSAIVMSRTARRVWCLDWHHGDGEMGNQDTLAEFMTNIRRHADERCSIEVLVGRTEAVLPVLKDGTFGLVYIDGSHDPIDVQHDTRHALRLLKPGGLVAWHDADREPVRRTIETFLPAAQFGPDRIAWGGL